MKGLRRVVFPLFVFLAFLAAAPAQTNTQAQPIRRYDSRIQMHEPVTLRVPDRDFGTQEKNPASTDREMMIPRETIDLRESPQESPTRPVGPRLRDAQEKQQNKSWIHASSTETRKKDDETTSDKKEEVEPSGWGWLADDVQARQQKQKEDEEASDSKDEKPEDPSHPDRQKDEVKPKTDGILLDTSFKPVSGLTRTKDRDTGKTEDTSARDERQDDKKDQADGPTTMESPRKRTAADQPREQNFGADATWGNEALWSKNPKPVAAMPQTEALLSMSKPDATKPGMGTDRPGFRPNAEAGAIHRAEPSQPEPARQSVVAAGFQPLPTAPVNELGTTPWDAGNRGGSSFSGSTPFSPAPVVTPSQPTQPTRSLALPQPVASPWLR
jgi:hypothetical protein